MAFRQNHQSVFQQVRIGKIRNVEDRWKFEKHPITKLCFLLSVIESKIKTDCRYMSAVFFQCVIFDERIYTYAVQMKLITRDCVFLGGGGSEVLNI